LYLIHPSSFIFHPFLTAGEILQGGAAGRQLGFLDDHNRKTIFRLENEPAALANEPVVVLLQSRVARVHGTTQDFEQLWIDHRKDYSKARMKDEASGPACRAPAFFFDSSFIPQPSSFFVAFGSRLNYPCYTRP
jgi:hypothetical protein